jgi:hypothetical protein
MGKKKTTANTDAESAELGTGTEINRDDQKPVGVPRADIETSAAGKLASMHVTRKFKKAPKRKPKEVSQPNPEDIPVNNDYSFLETVSLTTDGAKYFARPILSKTELADIRKKMDDDVQLVKSIFEKLVTFFQNKVDQIGINKKEFELTIPIDYMTMKFITILSVNPAWIYIKCKVMSLEDIPDKIKLEIYEKILVANFELNAVFYSIDPDMSGVWVENDLPVPGLEMELFGIDFDAIVFGIKYFVDSIAKAIDGLEMKSTFDAASMYT